MDRRSIFDEAALELVDGRAHLPSAQGHGCEKAFYAKEMVIAMFCRRPRSSEKPLFDGLESRRRMGALAVEVAVKAWEAAERMGRWQ
jgi:hypothetical protein